MRRQVYDSHDYHEGIEAFFESDRRLSKENRFASFSEKAPFAQKEGLNGRDLPHFCTSLKL